MSVRCIYSCSCEVYECLFFLHASKHPSPVPNGILNTYEVGSRLYTSAHCEYTDVSYHTCLVHLLEVNKLVETTAEFTRLMSTISHCEYGEMSYHTYLVQPPILGSTSFNKLLETTAEQTYKDQYQVPGRMYFSCLLLSYQIIIQKQ